MRKVIIVIVCITVLLCLTNIVHASSYYYMNDELGMFNTYQKQQFYYFAKKFEKNCKITLLLDTTDNIDKTDIINIADYIDEKSPSGNGVLHIRVFRHPETKNITIYVGRSRQLEVQITDIKIGTYLPSTNEIANNISWIDIKNLISKIYLYLLNNNDSKDIVPEYNYVDSEINDYNLKYNKLTPYDTGDYCTGAIISRTYNYIVNEPEEPVEEEPTTDDEYYNYRLIMPYFDGNIMGSTGSLYLYTDDYTYRNGDDTKPLLVFRYKYKGDWQFNWELERITNKVDYNSVILLYSSFHIYYSPSTGSAFCESGFQNGYTDDDIPLHKCRSGMNSVENTLNYYIVKINDDDINPYPPYEEELPGGEEPGGEEPGGENPEEEPPPDETIPSKIDEGIKGKLPRLKESLEKLSQLSNEDYKNLAPKFTINLNQLLNPAAQRWAPELINKADVEVIYFDASVLNEVEFLNIPVIEYFRSLLSGAMILMTAMYIWNKITPKDTIK